MRKTAPLLTFGMVIILGLATAGCGQSDDDEPPWGLTGIDMPATEEGIVAVFTAMPAIDGRDPTLLEEMGMVFYEGTDADAPGVYRSISAMPADFAEGPANPGELVGLIQEAMAEADKSDDVTVEASAVDPDGDLVWAVVTDQETEDGIPAYHLVWADPDGSWIFYATGDTAEFRVSLIQAFVDAVRSS